MPTISVLKSDFYRLAGLDPAYPLAALSDDLLLVKGELSSRARDGQPLRAADGRWLEPAGDVHLRIELADTNRPDLWCVEGVARQLRDHRAGCRQGYPFYTTRPAERRIQVDPRLEGIRPFIGGFLAEGGRVDEPALLAFIEGQEALDRNFGRRRRAVSIGLYDGRAARFPLAYRAMGWDEVRFEPLAPTAQPKEGQSWAAGVALTPREILTRHPTGQEYGAILEGAALVPLLADAAGDVLSLIPIINSAGLGRVTPGMTSLFIEATGVELDQVLLTLNILAANLADRGWTIQPVMAEYPYDTPRGRSVTAPHPLAVTQRVPLDLFDRVLGEQVEANQILQKLDAYGVAASAGEEAITATAPDYRQDYLHPVDVIEDFAISRGYASFTPLLPADFTVGRLDPLTMYEDLLRDLMIGFAFEEAICNILTSSEEIRQRMLVGLEMQDGRLPFHGGPTVRIENVMNLNYAHLRDWVLPSLFEIESHSEGALYPHRIFEVGEVAVFDPADNMGSRTESRLAALLAAEDASFDSAQSVLYALLNSLGLPFRVAPWEHPSFITGRVGLIVASEDGARADDPSTWLGFIGEFSPQVLANWGARVPAAGFELSVQALRGVRP